MRKRLIVGVTLVGVLALSMVAATGASAAPSAKAKGKRKAAAMRTIADKTVVGTSVLRYRGKNGGTLKGWVIVIGLVPDTTHAWHFHGRVKGQAKAPGNCKTQKDPVILAMDDLTSDARGVAIVRVNLKRIGKNPLLKGNYLNIHESASTDGVGPGIVCGMIKKAIV